MFNQDEIELLVEALNTWETRYRCSFCSHSDFIEKAAALRAKLFQLRETVAITPSLELLEAEMNKAVENEDYELAAKIKAEIDKMHDEG